jgi:L,D-peptidoglycan transpeptidase YkuD (ErfK/YbiS/YcfS/YnhG family)
VIKTVILLISLIILYGCSTPPVPPEVREAELQEHDLWRAGADIYATEEYKNYKSALRIAKDHLIKERAKFVLFRDYEPVQAEFRDTLLQGEGVLKKIQEQKQIISSNLANQITFFQNRIETLKKLTSLINEGRLSRQQLMKAEILLSEAQLLTEKGQYVDAEEKLKEIPEYTAGAIETILPILNRYADKAQITKWQAWVNDTIEKSKEKGDYSIIVSKIDKKLILYKSGKPYKTYNIELGKNGFKDKLHAGDMATPEGKYQIIKKLPKSRFYKALLINYPNEDDRRQFAIARRKGVIPSRVGIGGLIEIHGGGKEGMTYGCIAMENHQIAELFELVDLGTPVTIVGAIEYENSISFVMKEL